MAKWNKNKIDPNNINNGNEYTKNDQVSIQELNAIVNSGLYSQDSAEKAVNTSNDAKTKAESSETKSTNAENVANQANTKAETAEQNSSDALTASNNALSIANSANDTAEDALTKSNTALANSQGAINTATTAETNSQTALSNSVQAITTANNAEEVANGIDAKATSALSNSEQAVSIADEAKELAEQAVAGQGTKVTVDGAFQSNYEVNDTTLAQLKDDSTHRTVTDAEKSNWNNKQDKLTIDTSLSTTSTNPVQNKIVTEVLNEKLKVYPQSNYNANTLYNAGIYLIAGGSNLPSGAQYGSLWHMPYRKQNGNTTIDFSVQIYLPNGDDPTYPNSLFWRTGQRDGWNAWQSALSTNGGTITGRLEVTDNIAIGVRNLKNNDNKLNTGFLYEWKSCNITYNSGSIGTHTIDISSAIPDWDANNVYEVVLVNESYCSNTAYVRFYTDMFNTGTYWDIRFSTNGRQGGRIYTLPCHRYINYTVISNSIDCMGAVAMYRRIT